MDTPLHVTEPPRDATEEVETKVADQVDLRHGYDDGLDPADPRMGRECLSADEVSSIYERWDAAGRPKCELPIIDSNGVVFDQCPGSHARRLHNSQLAWEAYLRRASRDANQATTSTPRAIAHDEGNVGTSNPQMTPKGHRGAGTFRRGIRKDRCERCGKSHKGRCRMCPVCLSWHGKWGCPRARPGRAAPPAPPAPQVPGSGTSFGDQALKQILAKPGANLTIYGDHVDVSFNDALK